MPEQKKASLILADDHPLLLKGLTAALQNEFSITGVASDNNELLKLLNKNKPDLILTGLQTVNGLNAVRHVLATYPAIKLIVLSPEHNAVLADELRRLGVKGYLKKDIEIELLLTQLRSILSGGVSFNKPKSKRADNLNHPAGNGNPIPKLTRRELEIIVLIAAGFSSKQIAEKLYISLNTVEAHRKNIFKKLKIKNMQGIVEFAFKNSLITENTGIPL